MANFYGRLIHSDGDFYEGSWKNNKVNGKGKYQSEDGGIYDGECLNDTQHGYGVETYGQGDFLNNDIDDSWTNVMAVNGK